MSSEHTFSFLHAADAHLDAPISSASIALRERVRAAQRDAFRGLIDTALARDVDALLLAGDVLDGATLRPATAAWLPRELERALAGGITVVAVTGNHDWDAASIYPASAHVVGTRAPRTIEVRRDGTLVGRIVAAGHERAGESSSLVAVFPSATADGVPTVGLVHAEVAGATDADGHHRYAPTTARELDERGYAYWALGHIHRRQRLATVTEAWYAGTPQGLDLGPGELGAKGALLVQIERGSVAVTEVDLGPLRFLRIPVRLTAMEDTVSAVTSLVLDAVTSAITGSGAAICRVELSGRTPAARELGASGALSELADAVSDELELAGCEVKAHDLGVAVPDAIAQDPSLLPGASMTLAARLRAEPEKLAELNFGPLAAAPAEAAELVPYLESLLGDVDAEILSALVDGAGVGVPS